MFIASRTPGRLCGISAIAVVIALSSTAAQAGDTAASTEAAAPKQDDPTHPQANDIAEGSDIVVTGTRPNELAPVTASLQATQPQSIISRSFIEDSLPATADFNQIALISPSVSNFGGTNGLGMSETKAQIRGFQDGEYNITYDGVPFADQNDPTHHSNTFFPSNTVETLVIDRGPGNASQLGQATFGGNINMFSRAAREDASVELKGTYGSFDTYLLRGLAQSGAIDALGGTEFVVSAQHVRSDGARSFSPFKSNNVFGKAMIPLGPDVRLTILGTYNENRFNQPDKDGATLAQVALFGKNFSLNNDPNSQTYFGYNHTHKTTDFEIVKLEANFAPNSVFENRAYTYSYDNETLSGNDVTLFATAAQSDIDKANKVVLSPGGPKVFGVPGYTKTNKYRVYGDIAKIRINFGFGTATVGAWMERSNTFRQQRDVNLVTGAPNFAEKDLVLTKYPPGTVQPPANIKFDQHSHVNHTEEFAELELRPIDGLKITPGFKHVNFNRQIDAAYNQTTRFAQVISKTWTANLPFLTANYAINNRLSVYAEYARGFLAPPISVLYVVNPQLSTVAPERSTNYQAGVVYHGRNLSIDADIYKIDFKNKFASIDSGVLGTIFFNEGAVQYKGIEGQVTYAFDDGIAIFANGSRNYAKTDNPGLAHTQVPNAPFCTVAGGVLYKHGRIRASLIDKYTCKQYAVDFENPKYRIRGYNVAIFSARYDIGPVQIGFEVDNIFNSRRVTNVNQGKPVQVGAVTTYPFDQYFFQAPRQFTGDITVTF